MEEIVLKDKTVESFFLDIGHLERVYKSDHSLSLYLWNALRTDVTIDGPLNPDFYLSS